MLNGGSWIMGKNRLFIPQDIIDTWVDEERAFVEGESLSLSDDGTIYVISPAMLFLRESTGEEDPNEFVGRVKEEERLAELGADIYMDSVILGDNAYDVRRGFVAIAAAIPISEADEDDDKTKLNAESHDEDDEDDELAALLLKSLK